MSGRGTASDVTGRAVRIGVLSDTHIPVNAPSVPKEVLRGLEGVEMILHAGDLVDMGVVYELSAIADTRAVYGNMDPPGVRAALSHKLVLEVGKWRIGLAHGSGAPSGLADRVQAEFPRGSVDIVVFGHSHHACEDWRDGVFRFNPGSPTDRWFTDIRSYGILTLGETVESAIIRVA